MPVIEHESQQFELSHMEEQKLNEFQMITSFPGEELPNVIKLLKNHSWQLEHALGRYFDGNWKDNLELAPAEPPLAQQEHQTNIDEIHAQMAPNFMMPHSNLIPKLPIINRLPHDYKEKFQIVGLNNSKDHNAYSGNAVLVILMFLPNIILKVGIQVLSWIGLLLSYGLGLNLHRDKLAKAFEIPDRPNLERSPEEIKKDIYEVLGESAEGLLSLRSERSFNEIYDDCEANYKFMLLVFLGPVSGEETNNSSRMFLEHILGHPSTISLLKKHKDRLEIYISTVNDPECWAITRQMKLKYSLECLMVANVLNGNGSVNGIQRMSLLSSLRVKTLRKFQDSLKSTLSRYTPELVVSLTEMHELDMARKIKEMQDHAYQESLQRDKVKQEQRKQSKLEEEQNRLRELREKEIAKMKKASYHLSMLKESLKLLNEQACDPGEKLASIQIRTSDGNRIVRKFRASNSLRDIYLTIASHLYLDHHLTDKDSLFEAFINKIKKLCEDKEIPFFKDNDIFQDEDALRNYTLTDIEKMITKELGNISKDVDYDIDFDFELVSPFPRCHIPDDADTELKSLIQLWPNGSLLVESLQDENSLGEDDCSDEE